MGFFDRAKDRTDSSGRGNWRALAARLFENPENPLTWSLRLFVFRGITVRIHLVTIVYMIATLLWSILPQQSALAWMALAMASLFLVVLLHEFGHCFACRIVGGEADRIVMLPFGGLALCVPPDTPRAHLITAAGGPAVNLAIFPLSSGALALAGLSGVIFSNPFAPFVALTDPAFSGGPAWLYWVRVSIWWFHYVNIVIFGFNLLLVMFPFDGGRIIQSLVWFKTDYRRATTFAVNVGLIGAVVLAIVAIVMKGNTLLLAIAIFGGWACWAERRRLLSGEELGTSLLPALGDYPSLTHDDSPREPSRAELRKREAERREQRTIDEILAKISAQGLESLSRAERKLLDRASKKKRGA